MSNTSGVAVADTVGFMNAKEQQEHEEQRTVAASSQVVAAATAVLSPTRAANEPVPLSIPLPNNNNNNSNNAADAIYNFTSEGNRPLCLPKQPPTNSGIASGPLRVPPKKKRAVDDDDNDADYDPAKDKPKPKKRGRPKGKPKEDNPEPPKKRGAPKGKRSGIKFDVMIQQLQAYKATHGDCLVSIPQSKTSPTYKLALWVEQMRRQYSLLKRGDESAYLSMPQMVQLIEIGFAFSLRPTFNSWEERIEQCHAFIAQHGHLNIPRTDPVLGQWCSTTRTSYKRNTESKHTALTPVRQQQLDALGFVWLAGRRMPEKFFESRKPWADRFQEFCLYKIEHGHPFVPQHLEGGLGGWVCEQRVQYRKLHKGQKSQMTQEKALQLSTAGFAFDASSIRRTPKSARKQEDVVEDDDDDDDDDDDSNSDEYY
jgi:hypothetical protein